MTVRLFLASLLARILVEVWDCEITIDGEGNLIGFNTKEGIGLRP